MRTRLELTQSLLDSAYETLSDNLKGLTLEEALFSAPGGFRSVAGTIKHTAGWSHVYRSYAFDASPTSCLDLEWPRGLRDTIVKSEAYLAELVEWLELSHRRWQRDLDQTRDDELDQLRPVHWGDSMPLFDIVRLIANHHVYHAGEINQLLSIYRGQAWEEGEEMEENHISSEGHRVVPPWKQ
jgi:uncharacterized damage-inducible protein DinB